MPKPETLSSSTVNSQVNNALLFTESECNRLQLPLSSPLNSPNPLPSLLSKRFRPLSIITGPRTTSLSPSEPGRNALHNHGAPERKERIAPRHVGTRFVPRRLGVPANAFLAPRQPWNNPRRELRQLAVPTVHYVRTGKVAEVGERVSNGRHFPI